MTRQAHAIGNGVPNEYVQTIESVKELEAFAAVIYSSNFEFEAEGSETPPPGDAVDEARPGQGVGEGGAALMVGEGKGLVGGIMGWAGGVWGKVTGW